MKERNGIKWSSLDNASKIYPATSSEKDTRVFRFACELYEEVDPDVLQKSLDITIENFPLYRSVLRKGLFWYYFESSGIRPTVEAETKPVCAHLYISDRRNLLFRVFYHNCRINVEVFHSLSDGTGALWFIQTLVYNYLVSKYRGSFGDEMPKLSHGASESEKMDDSFRRYFPGNGIFAPASREKGEDRVNAYHIGGKKPDENRINLIEGVMPVKDVLKLAHRHGVTLTVYIASVFIYSIHRQMRSSEKNRPVVLLVPVNLRQFYESETARNFFGTMHIGYRFHGEDADFKRIISSVNESFGRELSSDVLRKQLNRYMSLEKHPLARIAPLPLKNYLMRIAKIMDDRSITATLSNVGRISMPPQFEPYIKQFSAFSSSKRPMITVCSYNERLAVGFTSPYAETDVQRNFFKFFSDLGIESEISSNL